MKGPTDMQGTCIDLEAAYRQCPVAKDERKYTVFAVKDPQTLKVIYFIANALPFGHRGSVPGFNRAAKALNHILHEDAGSSLSNYVDDFTLVGPKAIVQPQYARMLKLLTILGWKVKRKNLKSYKLCQKQNCAALVMILIAHLCSILQHLLCCIALCQCVKCLQRGSNNQS